MRKIEKISILKTKVWKINPDGTPRPLSANGAMKYIYPIQIYFTKYFLIFGFSPAVITHLWCFVGISAAIMLGFGTIPLTFIACLLMFLEIILDGSDGEVARYINADKDKNEDTLDFVYGIFIDKYCHAISRPLMRIGLGYGLYLTTGYILMLVFGLILGFITLYRQLIFATSAESVHFVLSKRPYFGLVNSKKTTMRSNIFHNLAFRYWNGKFLVFYLAIATMLDLGLEYTHMYPSYLARCSFLVVGTISCFFSAISETIFLSHPSNLNALASKVHQSLTSTPNEK